MKLVDYKGAKLYEVVPVGCPLSEQKLVDRYDETRAHYET